jgi:hypothetical protein
MHQNNISKLWNKHANSFHQSSIELKYSRNTPLNKILIGQSKESYTREQMLQISVTKMGDGAVMMVWELLLQSSATATENFWCQVDMGMCSK